jgi:large subunit ribosomal protein L17
MRHRKKGRKLGRTASHKKALLQALSTALLRHRKIQTTAAKAKEAQRFVEAVITRAKRALAREADAKAKDVHARREVFRSIKDRGVVRSLFEEIAPKVMNRPGGYTRLVKLGRRHGDGAELAVLELVDFSGAAAASAEKTEKGKSKEKAAKTKEASEPKKTSKRQGSESK